MKLFKSNYQKETFLFFTCAIFALSLFITVAFLGATDNTNYNGSYNSEMIEYENSIY